MKKKILAIIACALIPALLMPVLAYADTATGTEAGGYKIVSPYEDVVWSGDNAWGAYKGNLHCHSFVSDAQVDYREMILSHYDHGFDFLAMTDHGVTGKPWNEKPTVLPLYFYQTIIGNKVNWFTNEEYAAIQNGTYPVNGVARGRGMVDVPGGNELNALTITKDHVNGIFLPEHVGDNYLGYENDYEGAVKIAADAGALSFINHPGDWLDTNSDRANCADPVKIPYIADILLRYDSCLGIEVFNEHNGTTGYDRDTWDNLLMACLPYGKNIIGFSNGDTHYIRDVDSSFCVYMMEENTVENIRKTMVSGASFLVTRCIRADAEKFGPAESLDVRDQDIPYPTFTGIEVSGHTISVTCKDAYNIKWVANGNVIKSEDLTQTSDGQTFTINLDEIEGAEDFLYVRCQLLGTGGITLTQTFVIDDGTEPLTYEQDNSREAKTARLIWKFKALRICVLIQLIIDAISK